MNSPYVTITTKMKMKQESRQIYLGHTSNFTEEKINREKLPSGQGKETDTRQRNHGLGLQ